MTDPGSDAKYDGPTILGHPTGLYTLFFAEMWERFSYYGMRALLVFYMIKGFLGYGDSQAYTVYGAYTALVYMTPFIGGIIADRLLGQRVAIVIGGILMAAGHLLMTVESEWPFFFALAFLIVGNGFFKPNISTTVGTLYRAGSPKRDDGFNIFYMGINLGAAMSPLLCGYVGETYGWHYGFGLATIGMLVGLAVFVMPTKLTQLLILSAALASAVGMLVFRPDNIWAILINIFIAIALVLSAVTATRAIGKGGLPKWAGARPEGVGKRKDWMVYAGIVVAIPVFALLVSGLPFWDSTEASEVVSPATQEAEASSWLQGFGVSSSSIDTAKADGNLITERPSTSEGFQLIPKETIANIAKTGKAGAVAAVFLGEASKPAGLVLTVLGLLAFGFLLVETFRMGKIPRQRMQAALVLIFFQMVFFAFFEQAGSSVNNFTDRNVDRVGEAETVTADMVGQTLRMQPTQEQLGFKRDGVLFTQVDLDKLRKYMKHDPGFEIDWTISQGNIGMGLSPRANELPASIFQSVNPTYILLFAFLFNILWSFLRGRGWDPSAPTKFALGLFQLGLGFGAFWVGAQLSSDRGMVALVWLFLGYMLQTTGELCLSPVGLSAMTKLAPKHLVSTLMGSWFLATAFSQYLAAIISQFTGSSHGGGGGVKTGHPLESVHVYGDVFKTIAIYAIAAGAICLALSPILTRWMHQDEMDE